MKTVSEISAAILALNVFQIQELDKVVKLKMSSFGLPDRTVLPAVPSFERKSALSKFNVGDIVEFFSSRTHANVRVRIEKVNSVNLTARMTDAPFSKWRVAPSLCRLIGADKPETAPELSSTLPYCSVPTAAGSGAW